ncbi:hypothetical protein LINGRAHAP2_LOCUS31315 [Linum grandiflorum]
MFTMLVSEEMFFVPKRLRVASGTHLLIQGLNLDYANSLSLQRVIV